MTEEGFPRGGKKNKAENKRSNPDTGDVGGNKSKKKDKFSSEIKKNNFLRLDKKLELPSISYDTLVEGTLCLGCVRKVQESNLLIGLPGMTVGTVDIREISNPYTEVLEKLEKDQKIEDDEIIYPLDTMFKIGDVVVVKVMTVIINDKGKHRVTLSLNPQDIHNDWMATDLNENIVMTGAVKSKEDKGYIIDMGIKGVSAFLPMTSATITEKKLQRPLGIGQLISVNIVNCQIKRLMAKLTLNSVPSKVKQVCPPEGVAVKLLPGMKVSCIVVEKRASGLMVSFLDSIIGRVHNDHLAERHRADVSDTVFGRILFIPPWDVGPYLTLDEIKCFPYSAEPNSNYSQKLEQSDSRRRKGFVTSLEPRGAKLQLHGGGVALLKRQRASDKLDYTDEQFKKDFKLRSEHDVRVLEYSSLDGMFIVSCQEHLLDPTNVIDKDELQLGTVHKVLVVSYNTGGAVVKIGDVKGFIPYMHFKDKVLSPAFVQKKYPPGDSLLAKVFQIDLSRNSAVFTAKKTLRLSKGLVASSFTNLELGSKGHGVVRFIAPKGAGLRVQMIGGLLGFVPKGKIPTKETELAIPLENRFPIGFPVEFKVVEVDEQKGRAILTLDMNYEIPEKKHQSITDKTQRKRKATEESDEALVLISHKDKTKSANVRKKVADDEKGDDEEIPILIPISTKISEKRKRSTDEGKLVSKKKKLSETKNPDIPPVIPTENEEDCSAGPSKKPKNNTNGEMRGKLKEMANKEVQSSKVKKEIVDSGIDGESRPALKLSNKTFWDVLPSSSTSTNNDDQENQEDDDSASTDSNGDVGTQNKVDSAVEEAKPKNKGKCDKADKKSPKVDAETDSMTEKDHELRLIQNSGDPKHWRDFKDFALRNGDPAKAVSVIKRMKDKIPFRDENGKLLCWMTILQIETQYGTEESIKGTLEEAMKVNDPVSVLDKVAQFYESIDKKDEAEELLRCRLKMKLHESDSWINLGYFLYKNKKHEAARLLLPSALQQLQQSNQIYVTAKFAKFEVEHGDMDKGRSMFLTICLQRPKRIDLWLLYANSLYKMKQFQLAGDALRTSLSSKQLSPKESRPLIKRLVEIEKLHGTPESLLKLKADAADYLNITSASLA